jgi:hypothetical protein
MPFFAIYEGFSPFNLKLYCLTIYPFNFLKFFEF